MSLPGATNCLVSAVLEANKRTIVVVISGTPVKMPWASSTSTIVQSFYGGGESGNGLADVLFGKVNPSSKLPLTFPKVKWTHTFKRVQISRAMAERRRHSFVSKLPGPERQSILWCVLVFVELTKMSDLWNPSRGRICRVPTLRDIQESRAIPIWTRIIVRSCLVTPSSNLSGTTDTRNSNIWTSHLRGISGSTLMLK
jgi:hypothetical protein